MDNIKITSSAPALWEALCVTGLKCALCCVSVCVDGESMVLCS